MNNQAIDSFPFIVSGIECDTEKEAWETFFVEAESMFQWIKGKKVWRKAPELYSDKHFDRDGTTHVVTARVIAIDEIPEGLEEAIVRGPYPKEHDPFEGIEVLGMAQQEARA